MSPTAKNILRAYLHRLTNLTGTNRSLLVLRLQAEQLIDLHSLSFLNGERSFSILNALIKGQEKKLCPILDSRVPANNQVSLRLKKLQRIDRFIFEERGSNDLHVGWPFIRGKLSDGTLIRCPLIYFPVSLEQSDNHWILKPRKDAGIIFNKSFFLAYAFYNKVKLEEELLDTNFEDFDSDSTAFRTEVYQLLKDKIEINFNPDNFRDELTPFQEFKREEFEETHQNESLKLFPEAVLGIFPQAGSQLVPDYMQLLEDDSVTDLEDFFLREVFDQSDSTESNVKEVKEEKIYTPFAMDAYQEKAIQLIKKGKSLVVQGPPGTGKSQLIANLMADAIASGKRALLVCQKRAALDVVYDRLKTLDIGDFLGLVHDFRNDKKNIYEKIARQIDRIDEFKAKNRSVDSIQMERKFFQACRSIDLITEELESFRTALADDKECGMSVKELYLTSNPHADMINIRQEYQYFKFDHVKEFARNLRAYAGYATVFCREDYVWRDRKSFSSYRLSDLKEIEKTIRHIGEAQEQIKKSFEDKIGVAMSLEDAEAFRAREDDVLGMVALLKKEEAYQYLLAMIEESGEETSLLWFSNLERVALSCFSGEGVESTLSSEELVKFQEALQKRMKIGIIRRFQWELFSKDRFLVKRVLIANKLPYTKAGLEVLEQRLDNRLNLEHHLTAARKKLWLKDVPDSYDVKKFRSWFEQQKFAIRVKLTLASLREIRKAIHPQTYSRDEFISLFRHLLDVVQFLPVWKQEWAKYLTPYQIRILTTNSVLHGQYIDVVKRDFDNLTEFDKLIEKLSTHEKDVVQKLHDTAKTWDASILENLFQNSIRLTWIDHIEVKHPILRSVSSLKMEELQSELQHQIDEKQKLSKQILLMRARERVYDDMAYNRLNNRVTYRDLQHQVVKKKKIWPLRKVIAEFSEELFRLLPCWLASPESVSAIFPLQQLFDVVIFDEASQCFSERGIPAMYRGRQLLVAGDGMQLKPSELYQVRWDDETDHPDLEIDSLLGLSERYLSTVHLQGHYRSKSFELIDFSNRHFYGHRLQVLPDRVVVNKKEPAIEYCKVDGVWEDHTNEQEAIAVVQKILAIENSSPEKEIGVVTFNAPQQMFIFDLLEDEFAKQGRTIPASILVKNIENIQGDERDVIIFSTGYAPDKKGKLVMQFGTFSLAGGENRLNVAVTRAREKIIVVSSIWPEQLRTDDVKNEGPRLLKEYLVYARNVDQQKFALQRRDDNSGKSPEWFLNERLRTWITQKFSRVEVFTNTLPFSDLHITKNDLYDGVILTDDARYMDNENIKDNHAYTPVLLQKKHWKHIMIYSRNFWLTREKVEYDLARFIGSENQEG